MIDNNTQAPKTEPMLKVFAKMENLIKAAPKKAVKIDDDQLERVIGLLPIGITMANLIELNRLAKTDLQKALQRMYFVARSQTTAHDMEKWKAFGRVMLMLCIGTIRYNRAMASLAIFVFTGSDKPDLSSPQVVKNTSFKVLIPECTLRERFLDRTSGLRTFFGSHPLGIIGAAVSLALTIALLYWHFFLPAPVSQPSKLPALPPISISNNRPAIPERTLPPISSADLKIGARRHEITPEPRLMHLRELLMNDMQTFFMLHLQDQANGVDKVLQYDQQVVAFVNQFAQDNQEIVRAFTEQFGLPAENFPDMVLAVIWKESNGDPGAVSSTGPRGILQFAAATAADEGLCTPVYKTDDKGKPIIIGCSKEGDYRSDPNRAIPAWLNLLKKKFYELHKRLDLAIFAVHSGGGDVKSVLAAAEKDGLKWKTYNDLFFADPKYKNTHLRIRQLSSGKKGENFGATYYYGVRRLMELIWVRIKNPERFQILVAAQRSKSPRNIKPDAKGPCGSDPLCAPFLAHSWYGMADVLYKDTAALLSALKTGELIPLEDKTGITIQSSTTGGIASEARDANEARGLRSLRPLADIVAAIIGKQFSRFVQGKDLKLSSAVRSLEYQEIVEKEDVSVPMHVTGMTFDISKMGLSEEEKAIVAFILDELQYCGLISWIDEVGPGYNAFHVVVSPSDYAKSILAP